MLGMRSKDRNFEEYKKLRRRIDAFELSLMNEGEDAVLPALFMNYISGFKAIRKQLKESATKIGVDDSLVDDLINMLLNDAPTEEIMEFMDSKILSIVKFKIEGSK